NQFIDDEWLIKNKIIAHSEKKTITPKDEFDPKVLVYDPTTLAGEWEQDETTKKWTKCSRKFKPYRPQRPAVMKNVLEGINNTPLVKLNKVPKENGVDCNIEFDPKVLVYDPTTLAGEWEQDETTKKWTKCSRKFKPYRPQRPAVMKNVLEGINNTPLVKLNKVPKENGVDCNMCK
ncbi:hypothetical protein OESDEN_17076, partial [Oesophagostomum dentatum]